MPVVSIIIPTHNRAGMLREAIKSVQVQTFTDWELIVVNDGSTDLTDGVVTAYAAHDARIHLVWQDNRGSTEARNTGVRASRGLYLAFLDDDDLWLPEKLALQVRCMEGPVKPGLTYTLTSNVDARTNAVYRVVPDHPGRTYTELFMKNFIPCPSVMVRRECLERVGFFKKMMSPAEDYDLWLRIAREYPIDFVPYPLAVYRRHGNNISDKTLNMFQADLRIVRLRSGDQRLIGGQRTWRRRLAGVYYEIARWAIDRRRWMLACRSLAQSIRWAPNAGLTVKRYRDSRRMFDVLTPYAALGYCGIHWAFSLGREPSS